MKRNSLQLNDKVSRLDAPKIGYGSVAKCITSASTVVRSMGPRIRFRMRNDNSTATAPRPASEPRIANDSGLRFKPARTVYRSWESQTQMAGEAPERQ